MHRKPLTRPFGHFRLTAFFVAIALGGIALGILLAHAHEGAFTPRDVAWIAGAAVTASVAVGFAGVFFHRLRINPVRWRETAEYVAAVRRESTKYRALMDGAADLLLVVDPRSQAVVEASRRAREVFGLAEVGTAPVEGCFEERDRERFSVALRRAAAVEAENVALEELAMRTTRAGTRLADARFAAVRVDGLVLVQVALRDVTEEKEMERSLVVHERLSSIGLLTSGVAHEINNPLEGIGNYLKLLERPDLTAETRARYLAQVRHGFDRIGEIVRDLLHFARSEPGSGTADLVDVVERALKLARYSSKLKSVAIEQRGLAAPLLVRGDAGRLEQVVVNLLLNAGTATAGQGRITIGAERTPAGEVELSVEDDGPGIAPEDLTRIFDPFFTRTEGTGLGLFVSYGIMAAHGGRIRAENRPAGGARFTLVFPARVDEAKGA